MNEKQKRVLGIIKDIGFFALLGLIYLLVNKTCDPVQICQPCLYNQYFNVSNLTIGLP